MLRCVFAPRRSERQSLASTCPVARLRRSRPRSPATPVEALPGEQSHWDVLTTSLLVDLFRIKSLVQCSGGQVGATARLVERPFAAALDHHQVATDDDIAFEGLGRGVAPAL